MITILHGDDTVKSRNRLTELALTYDSVTHFHAEKNTTGEILQTLSSVDLFIEKKCIVIEHISKILKDDYKKLEQVLPSISKNKNLMLILWVKLRSVTICRTRSVSS